MPEAMGAGKECFWKFVCVTRWIRVQLIGRKVAVVYGG